MHVRHIHPHEERGFRIGLPLDEVDARAGGLVVDGLHPLGGQRPGVVDTLLAGRTEPLVDPIGGLLGRPGMDDAAGHQMAAQQRRLFLGRVVGVLRFLFGVEVIKVAEELVEAVRGGQVLVEVAEVVLAELPGGVSQRFEQLCDRGVFR